MPPYAASMLPKLGDQEVSEESASTDGRIRRLLLWESHEINFRCEVMALDACLVPRDNWTTIQRWGREAFVSECWGPSASLSSVVPSMPPNEEPFCWPNSQDNAWTGGLRYLVRFLDVLVQWEGCPVLLKDMRSTSAVWTAEDYDLIQREATNFYVRTFVSKFGRLPIAPILYVPS